MIRVTIAWGPLNRTAEIHESTGRRLNEFAGKWRAEGETWGHFVERVMAIFEAAVNKTKPEPEPEPKPDPFRGVKPIDGRVSVRVLLCVAVNVASVGAVFAGQWLWAVGLSLAGTALAWPTFRELWKLWKMYKIIRGAFRDGGPPGSKLDPPEDFPAVAPPDPELEKVQEIFPDLCDVCGHAPHHGMTCPECEPIGGSHAT